MRAAQGPCLDSLVNLFGERPELLRLIRIESAQDEIYLAAFTEIVSYAHAYAAVVAGFKELFDVPEAVMPPATAGSPHPHGAERQVDVIADYDEILKRDFKRVHPIPYGVAAQIHVGGGLEQVEFASLYAQLCHFPIAAGHKGNIGRLSPGVQYYESDVVPRAGIFLAYVAQSDYEETLVRHGLGLLCGDYGVARGLDSADDGILVGDNGDTVELDVAGLDPLVEAEGGDVNGNLIGKLGHGGADAEFAGVLIELTTLLDTDCVAGDDDGDFDADRLDIAYCQEINMHAGIGDGVPLELVKDGGVFLASVEDEVDDVGLGGVGDSLELFCIDGEVDVLDAETIEVAGDESLCAEGLEGGFALDFTGRSVEFEMLHSFNIKMCYSSRYGPGPIAPKPVGFRNAGANIRRIIYDSN